MNERVKELVKLSMKPRWITNAYNGAHEYSGDELDVQKFAELIVRECVDICNQMYFDDFPDAEDFERSAEGDAIKKHFGVE